MAIRDDLIHVVRILHGAQPAGRRREQRGCGLHDTHEAGCNHWLAPRRGRGLPWCNQVQGATATLAFTAAAALWIL